MAQQGDWAQPKSLAGRFVSLQPLQPSHAEALWGVAQHDSIWQYMPFPMTSADDMRAMVQNLLHQQQLGESLPFITVLADSGEVIGATSYLAMNSYNRRLEIGATWITPAHQRSPANTEAKLLQFCYAFDELGCNRVEFKTDALNKKSRAALTRIGAKEEGTHRAHMVMPDGRLRDSVYFSVIAGEWPDVRANLEAKLNA